MRRDRWLLIAAAVLIAILLGLFAIGSRGAKDAATNDKQQDEVLIGAVLPEYTPAQEPGQPEDDPNADDEPDPSEDDNPSHSKDHNIPLAEDEEGFIKMSIEDLKYNASTSTGMWEFVQRFFTDVIVYRDEGGEFAYEPVDTSLPLSDYDWDKLKEIGLESREVEYVVDGETVSHKGIDVSRYQGTIDWEKVAGSGVEFAFIRLGYRGYSTGLLVVDECFEYNVTEALENGIAVGVYFVTQAVSEEEAVEEAEFVLETIAPYNVTWPIVLDSENAGNGDARTVLLTRTERTDYACAFCDRIKEAGRTPVIYSNIRWFMTKLDLSMLTDYDKWFAQYFNKPFFPYAFQIWQYTDCGEVDGIEGDVDLNISFIDYSEGE